MYVLEIELPEDPPVHFYFKTRKRLQYLRYFIERAGYVSPKYTFKKVVYEDE